MHASAAFVEVAFASLIKNLNLQNRVTSAVATPAADLNVSIRNVWISGAERDHALIVRSARKAAQACCEILDRKVTAVKFR